MSGLRGGPDRSGCRIEGPYSVATLFATRKHPDPTFAPCQVFILGVRGAPRDEVVGGKGADGGVQRVRVVAEFLGARIRDRHPSASQGLDDLTAFGLLIDLLVAGVANFMGLERSCGIHLDCGRPSLVVGAPGKANRRPELLAELFQEVQSGVCRSSDAVGADLKRLLPDGLVNEVVGPSTKHAVGRCLDSPAGAVRLQGRRQGRRPPKWRIDSDQSGFPRFVYPRCEDVEERIAAIPYASQTDTASLLEREDHPPAGFPCREVDSDDPREGSWRALIWVSRASPDYFACRGYGHFRAAPLSRGQGRDYLRSARSARSSVGMLRSASRVVAS